MAWLASIFILPPIFSCFRRPGSTQKLKDFFVVGKLEKYWQKVTKNEKRVFIFLGQHKSCSYTILLFLMLLQINLIWNVQSSSVHQTKHLKGSKNKKACVHYKMTQSTTKWHQRNGKICTRVVVRYIQIDSNAPGTTKYLQEGRFIFLTKSNFPSSKRWAVTRVQQFCPKYTTMRTMANDLQWELRKRYKNENNCRPSEIVNFSILLFELILN